MFVGGDFDKVAFFEKDEAVGDRAQREHVRGEEVLADADADHQRTADTRTDQSIRLVARHHADRIGAFELLDRQPHRIDQDFAPAVCSDSIK